MENFQVVVEYIQTLRSYRELNRFLRAILTQSEMKELVKRFHIIHLLAKGWSYKAISKKYKIGASTISRLSKLINQGYFSDVPESSQWLETDDRDWHLLAIKKWKGRF